MATHPSILAWRILWTGEPFRLQFMGSQKLDTTELLSTVYMCMWYIYVHTHTHIHTPHFYLLSHQKVGTCFHILAIVSNAALNMKKRFFCKMVILFPTHIYPEVGVSSHMAVLISWGTSMLFSIVSYQFTFPPTVQNWSLSFISLMTLIACGFDTGHSNMWSNSLLQFYFAFHWLALFCIRWMYIKET